MLDKKRAKDNGTLFLKQQAIVSTVLFYFENFRGRQDFRGAKVV